jgi:hypothetical protein
MTWSSSVIAIRPIQGIISQHCEFPRVDLPAPVAGSWGMTDEPVETSISFAGMVVIDCHIHAMNFAVIGGSINV